MWEGAFKLFIYSIIVLHLWETTKKNKVHILKKGGGGRDMPADLQMKNNQIKKICWSIAQKQIWHHQSKIEFLLKSHFLRIVDYSLPWWSGWF